MYIILADICDTAVILLSSRYFASVIRDEVFFALESSSGRSNERESEDRKVTVEIKMKRDAQRERERQRGRE